MEIISQKYSELSSEHDPFDIKNECLGLGYTCRRIFGFALTLTAIILMLPANMMPFMSFEVYGQRNESTIFSGAMSLWNSGSVFIAAIVLFSSLFIPLLKLSFQLCIQYPSNNPAIIKRQMSLHRFVEVIGPWSMLDIFLVAIFVATIKLGSMGTVNVEPGAFVFLIVVCLTIISSQIFGEKHLDQSKRNHEVK